MMSMSIAASAVQSALTRADTVAAKAALGPTSPSYVSDVVDLNVAQREVESAVKVLQTQDEILGYLLDELA
jgi:hypothetical protein